MSNLQISLAVIGVVLLVLIVAYNSWSARKNAPKRAEPENQEVANANGAGSAANAARLEPGMETVGHGADLTHSLREPVLGDFGASPKLGLDETAQALGLPGKWNGHGGNVADQAAAGDYAAINRYCEGDVLNTYALYLRWACFSTGHAPKTWA